MSEHAGSDSSLTSSSANERGAGGASSPWEGAGNQNHTWMTYEGIDEQTL